MDSSALLANWPSLLYFALLAAILLLQLLMLRRLRLARYSLVATGNVPAQRLPTREAGNMATAKNPENLQSAASPSAVEATTGGVGKQPRRQLRFVMDSLFVTASYRFVCSKQVESFHYITGTQLDEATFCLLHIVPVEYSHQSMSGVRVADASNITTLARLDDWGLPLLGHSHSHPAHGPGGTKPSATDERFIKRLADGGHIAIGLLFSRDGFVRFYAHDSLDFSVEIRGNHVSRVEEKIYVIDRLADSDFSLVGGPCGEPGRSRSGRSPRPGTWF